MNNLSTRIAAITMAIFGAEFVGQNAAHAASIAIVSHDRTIHNAGIGLATLLQVKLAPSQKRHFEALVFDNLAEAARLVRDQKVDFAILPAAYEYFARNAAGPFTGEPPAENLRTVMALWRDVEHFLGESDQAASGNVPEFQNRNKVQLLSTWTREPTRAQSNPLGVILGDHPGIIDLTSDNAAKMTGKFDVVGIRHASPSSLVEHLLDASEQKLQLLDFTEGQVNHADGGRGVWTPHHIPAFTYPDQVNAIHTMAQSVLLLTHEDADENLVHDLSEVLFENASYLWEIDNALRGFSPDRALIGLTAPLHEGAKRFFRKRGFSEEALNNSNARSKKFNLYFDENSSELNLDAKMRLNMVRNYIDEVGRSDIWIRGYADGAGPKTYNMDLSRARADSVVDALQRSVRTIADINVEAHGEQPPVMAPAEGAPDIFNRRVEVIVKSSTGIQTGEQHDQQRQRIRFASKTVM